MVEDIIKTLQKALEQKAKTAFEIQIQLNETKTIAYPHDYKWVSLEDVKTELASFRVEYDKQVHPSRKQLQDKAKTTYQIGKEASPLMNLVFGYIVQEDLKKDNRKWVSVDELVDSASDGMREKLKEDRLLRWYPKPEEGRL